MVEKLLNKNYISLLDFIRNNVNDDFYITNNNQRLIIQNDISLKIMMKQCHDIYVLIEKGDILGVICSWKSIGNNVTRYYVKLNATNENVANKLLTILLWNANKELYAKIKKNSKFYKIFRNKRFEFIGDRGKEVLLVSPKIIRLQKENNNYIKD